MTAGPRPVRKCASCGWPDRLTPVAVRSRATGERRVLKLCDRCAELPDRTWRLRFEPMPATPRP